MPSKAVLLGGAAAAIIVATAAWWSGAQDGVAAPQPAAPSMRAAGQPAIDSAGQASADTPVAKAERRRALLAQVALADTTYCTYAGDTKYPPVSRPISEHPDQVYPNAPVTDEHALRGADGSADAAVQIQTSQSRVFMASGETVAFSVRAVDAQGKALSLVITRAAAQGVTYTGQRASAQIALAFADDGEGADAVAGDGALAGILAPAQTGLASFNGTIRTELRYSVAGKNGFVLFDVIYTPELPATWTGQAREAVEDGALVYYLKANVLKAGRYVVQGRVDDAKGRPFAIASFNDVLAAGPAELKLTVFGKLLRDKEAALPLTLRDVDGYLLKENVDPDRALLPRLEGKVVVGKPHPLAGFSDAEWHSEERARHLVEFAKDVALAKAALGQFDPALAAPKSACLP
ncbi:hypothetical protein [Massilia sp. TSP1-1-2]|uniref:hypothetical protein n=1 Tax=Massilia sp. TSP1-1-2 TaxID=2804649 RepID=UPI003CFABE6C